MIGPTELPEELKTLLAAAIDGELDADGRRRLGELVQGDADALRLYARLMWLDAHLEEEMSERLADASGPPPKGSPRDLLSELSNSMVLPAIRDEEMADEQPQSVQPFAFPASPMALQQPPTAQPRGWMRPTRLAAAILLVAGSALAIILYQLGIFGGNSPQPIAMGPSLDAIWSDPGAVAAAGSLIKTGVLQSLTSGYAELTSPNGLVVIIEGPATFTVEKPDVVSLTFGKLTATVPKPARGFTVNTPVSRIVDLGTEFGVSVDVSGQTDVQTFHGTVSLISTTSSPSAPANLITAGAARRVSASGDITEVSANATAFVRPQQFDCWKAMPQGIPYERWKAYSERLRHDPDLIAYYTFDNATQEPDRLLNQSSYGTTLDGNLGQDDPDARPRWSTGRWPETGALDFGAANYAHAIVQSGVGDPLDFSHGDKTASPFTIATWIRVDVQPDHFVSVLAKGFGGAEQFGIDLSPTLNQRAWVRRTPSPDKSTGCEVHGADLVLGRWAQLVMTYEPASHSIRFYVNGRLSGQRNDAPDRLLETDQPVTIGARRDSKSADGTITYVAPFEGRMGELAILRRALSAEQVQEMYRAGTPD